MDGCDLKLSPVSAGVVEPEGTVSSPEIVDAPTPNAYIYPSEEDGKGGRDSVRTVVKTLDFGGKSHNSDDTGRNRLITLGVGFAFVVASILTHSR